MKWIGYLYIILLGVLPYYSIAQNHSCYHQKSQLKSIHKAENIDNRGDFIDITNYNINLDLSDFTQKKLNGFTEISLKAKQNNISTIDLDLLHLTVDSVVFSNSQALNFTYNDTTLHIDFPFSLNKNTIYKLKVFYKGTPVQISGDWGGFFWNNTYAFNIGVSFTETIHNFGKVWFPCFDNFVERSTYRFAITTQAQHKAFCNGILQSEIDNGNGTKTWHWFLEEEIPTYLANVAVAQYATVNQTYQRLGGTSVPIQLASLPSDTNNLKASFVHLKDALRAFETRFGAYRFSRVGYCLSSFSAGAMEHATNITYMAAVANGTTQYETLMAHELSHHWFGNNTTCQTAADMWLNEGWATYAEAIFTDWVYGKTAFKNYNRKNHDEVLRLAHIKDNGYYPVAGVPTEKTYSTTVYRKGADMAHSIRGILGDDLFFAAIDSFQSKRKFSDITTNDLETFLSQHTGLNLLSFFNTFIKEKGFHHFEISDLNVIEQNETYQIQGSIRQKLWQATTYTDFLPLEITFFDENWNKKTKTLFVYGACSDFQLQLDFKPIFWALDLEEKIQDATVDKYSVANTTGLIDLGLGRIKLDIKNISDSALLRATHHYIKPDALQNKKAGLHLSPNRYWSFSGILPSNFQADAIFQYNGSTNNATGYLDNDFIDVVEDSLVLLYRQNPKEDWAVVDSFSLNTQGSNLDKIGEIKVFNALTGDYVLAKYKHNQAIDTESNNPCLYTGIKNPNQWEKAIQIFPVPTQAILNIHLLKDFSAIKQLSIYNIAGKIIFEQTIHTDKLQIDTKKWKRGVYFIHFKAKNEDTLHQQKIILE